MGVNAYACSTCPMPVVGIGPRFPPGQREGVPDNLLYLVDTTASRKCQLIAKPTMLTQPYAVWLVQNTRAMDAIVFARVVTGSKADTYSAPLDGRTAAMLSALCSASLTFKSETCHRRGMDGVWYYAAHSESTGAYATAYFWSPDPDGVPGALLKLLVTLRDYAVVPESLRATKWVELQNAAIVLDRVVSQN